MKAELVQRSKILTPGHSNVRLSDAGSNPALCTFHNPERVRGEEKILVFRHLNPPLLLLKGGKHGR